MSWSRFPNPNKPRQTPVAPVTSTDTGPLLFDDQIGTTWRWPHEADDSDSDRSEVELDCDNVNEEPWEAEVKETLTVQVEIHGWKELQDQIKDDLKKKNTQ